jgi:hypothetical protein
MKKYVLLIVLGLIGSFSFGIGDIHETMPQTINQIVSYPSDIQMDADNNYAVVEFSVNEEGVVEVNSINACEELKAYVLQRLDGYKLIDPAGLSGKTFQYKLSFKK